MSEPINNRFSALRLVWIFEAYWRLWPIRLRLKYAPTSWLAGKIVRQISSQTSGSVVGREENTQDGSDRVKRFDEMHEAVRLAARCHYGQPACLPRSLVLADMLKFRKLSALVKVGVRLGGVGTERQLASHAWVEVEGEMIGEPEVVAEDFTQLS